MTEKLAKVSQKHLNAGFAKILASKNKSEDKLYKINNPKYIDKPYLLTPTMYDKKMKELISTG